MDDPPAGCAPAGHRIRQRALTVEDRHLMHLLTRGGALRPTTAP
ncbi:hypothetical protein [Modestobacter marinus]|nr:hypothetical protein [Modestobacter marinus]